MKLKAMDGSEVAPSPELIRRVGTAEGIRRAPSATGQKWKMKYLNEWSSKYIYIYIRFSTFFCEDASLHASSPAARNQLQKENKDVSPPLIIY